MREPVLTPHEEGDSDDARCEFVWEWRTFEELQPAHYERIHSLSLVDSQRVQDGYFVIQGRLDVSVKVRSGSLRVKRLHRDYSGIQKWAHIDLGLPISSEFLLDCLGIAENLSDFAPVEVGADSLTSFLSRLSGRTVQTIILEKYRRLFRYQVGNCPVAVEMAEFRLQERCFFSLALNGESAASIAQAMRELGLEAYRPCSYPEWLVARVGSRHHRLVKQ